MKFINLTPHTINEQTTGQEFLSQGIARVQSTHKQVAKHQGIAIFTTEFGTEVTGLPVAQEGIIYIVSALVLNATNRKDLVAPGNLQRNATGQPLGCLGFRVKESSKC